MKKLQKKLKYCGTYTRLRRVSGESAGGNSNDLAQSFNELPGDIFDHLPVYMSSRNIHFKVQCVPSAVIVVDLLSLAQLFIELPNVMVNE